MKAKSLYHNLNEHPVTILVCRKRNIIHRSSFEMKEGGITILSATPSGIFDYTITDHKSNKKYTLEASDKLSLWNLNECKRTCIAMLRISKKNSHGVCQRGYDLSTFDQAGFPSLHYREKELERKGNKVGLDFGGKHVIQSIKNSILVDGSGNEEFAMRKTQRDLIEIDTWKDVNHLLAFMVTIACSSTPVDI